MVKEFSWLSSSLDRHCGKRRTDTAQGLSATMASPSSLDSTADDWSIHHVSVGRFTFPVARLEVPLFFPTDAQGILQGGIFLATEPKS